MAAALAGSGIANLKTHIETVVKHFKGKVKGWDVVNEAVNDAADPYLRNTPAPAIGDDYVLKAFEFAHKADPDAELSTTTTASNSPPNANGRCASFAKSRRRACGSTPWAFRVTGRWNRPA